MRKNQKELDMFPTIIYKEFAMKTQTLNLKQARPVKNLYEFSLQTGRAFLFWGI